MVVGCQPKEHASGAAHEVGQVLVFALDQALQHWRDVALKSHLLKCHFLALLLLNYLLSFFVMMLLMGILKLVLRNEAVGDVG